MQTISLGGIIITALVVCLSNTTPNKGVGFQPPLFALGVMKDLGDPKQELSPLGTYVMMTRPYYCYKDSVNNVPPAFS